MLFNSVLPAIVCLSFSLKTTVFTLAITLWGPRFFLMQMYVNSSENPEIYSYRMVTRWLHYVHSDWLVNEIIFVLLTLGLPCLLHTREPAF